MSRARVFALVALLPAALGTTPGAARALVVPICVGEATGRTIVLPLNRMPVPASDPPGCCVKGCHAGSRKRSCGDPVDPAQ